VDLTNVTNNTGEAAGDTYVGIEAFAGSRFNDLFRGNFADNTFIGARGNDTLRGNGGDDRLIGGSGDDTLDGGVGADRLEGGDGFDRAIYSNAGARIVIDLLDAGMGEGFAAGDSFVSVEQIIGSDFGDTISGDETANFFEGGGGRDTLVGRAGADSLSGGAGDDDLNGGLGADNLDGGLGTDTASYAGASAGVRADLQSSRFNNAEAAGDTYSSIEGLRGSSFVDDLRGDGGDNQLAGQSGDDFLTGRAGDDMLFGGAGRDVLRGGTGADALDGGSGLDYASYSDSSVGIRVDLAFSQFNNGIAAGDTYSRVQGVLGSAQDDDLRGDNGQNALEGGAGRDFLTGRSGNDFLRGGSGNDVLTGGAGNDVLAGNGGQDVFRFFGPDEGVDRILDFKSGEDELKLDDGGFSALSRGALSADNFRNGAVALDGDDYILYDNDRLYYDADGNGAGAAVHFATIENSAVLDADDFLII
jgi:Ca2+-binding RTX toxin-like protein